MSDNDLIRRGDALKVACAGMRRYGFGLPGGRVDQMQFAINTLPAVQPTVKPLRYTEPEGETLEQMRDHARQHPLAQSGDMRLVWVNEGDLHMHTIFHAVQPTVSPDMIEIDIRAVMMERIEEAASQSPWVPPEYAMNEIISDCCSFLREPRDPSPDVAALERILRERGAVFDAMVDAAEDAAGKGVSFNVVIGRALRAALASVKGVM